MLVKCIMCNEHRYPMNFVLEVGCGETTLWCDSCLGPVHCSVCGVYIGHLGTVYWYKGQAKELCCQCYLSKTHSDTPLAADPISACANE